MYAGMSLYICAIHDNASVCVCECECRWAGIPRLQTKKKFDLAGTWWEATETFN